jgi:UDP-N-acetylmuramoyl-tripeptide--D-alanyl-D-alanine ligase
MNLEKLYEIYLQHQSVQTDTRKLKPGDLFFALKGANYNGNQYAKQALSSGAVCCIVDEDCGFEDERIFRVDDVLSTLQELALLHRTKFKIPFLAVTGSNGKTTTKELIHAVLSSYYKTYTTEGNLNNHIGIPLTLLNIRHDAEMAVVEMGANHQKEIEGYCRYALPTHGLITNCGKAHLEGFGGEEGVKKGKGELFDYLRSSGGTAFVYADFDYLIEMSKGIGSVITYASNTTGTVIGHSIDNGGDFLTVEISQGIGTGIIQTSLVGGYNLPNVLAAICVGKYFGVPDEKVKYALETYQPSNSRSQLVQKDGNTIILDAYNANPSSMQLAIDNFEKMKGEKKILMLGAMMELGEESDREHKKIVDQIDAFSWDAVVLVGSSFEKIHGKHIYFSNSKEAAQWFRSMHFHGFHVLIKGSRSMKMELVLE